jgi:competence protein ComEA
MLVEDGMQIWVPAVQVDESIDIESKPTSQAKGADRSTKLVNINSASQAELETLSGIGPVKAQSIVQFRLENGPFKEVEELQSVAGIGPVTFEKIRRYITVGGATSE